MRKSLVSIFAVIFLGMPMAVVFAAGAASSVFRDTAGFIRPLIVTDFVQASFFTATSTTRASTFPYASTTAFSFTSTSTGTSGVNITGGCFAFNGACINGVGTVGAGTTGQNAYYSALNTVTGTSTVFIGANGFVGIGTTTPWGRLSVQTPDNQDGTMPMFVVASSSNVAFVIGSNGGISIGTSTVTSNRELLIQHDFNGAGPNLQVRNQSNGNAANATILLSNDAGAGFNQQVFSSGFTQTNFSNAPNSGKFFGSGALTGGVSFGATAAGAPLIFMSGGTVDRGRFDGNNGFFGISTSSPMSNLDVLQTTGANARFERYAASPGLDFIRFNGSNGSPTTVVNGQELGEFSGFAYNGTSISNAARYTIFTDATPAGGISPGRLVFQNVGADGILRESARITSGLLMGVGTSTPFGQLSASSTSAFPTLAIEQKSTGPVATFIGGNFGIGTVNPLASFHLSGLSSIFGSITNGIANAFNFAFASSTNADSAGANATFDASNGAGSGASGDLIFRTSRASSPLSVTLDATSTQTGGGATVTNITWTHTIGASCANPVILVSLAPGAARTYAASSTLSGNFTKIASSSASTATVQVLSITNPTVGSQTISVTQTDGLSAQRLAATAVSYCNVNQTSPYGTIATTSNASATSLSLTSSGGGQLIFDALGKTDITEVPAANAGQTNIAATSTNQATPSNNRQVANSQITVNGVNTTTGWTWATARAAAYIQIPVNSVNSASAGNFLDRLHISSNGNVGISTSTPWGRLSIAEYAPGNVQPFFVIASSTSANATSTAFLIAASGHIIASSTSPVLSACGTGPSMVGSDSWGTVTTGATAGGCVVTFQQPWATAPVCVVTPQTGSVVNTFSYSVSATAITVTEVGLGGGLFDFYCSGRSGSR